jgi:starch synthase
MRMKSLLMASAVINSNVREAALAFWEGDWLRELHVPLAWYRGGGSRRLDPRLRAFVRQHPWREIGRLAGARLGWQKQVAEEGHWFSIENVGRNIGESAARSIRHWPEETGVAYGYEDGARELFEAAQERGWRKIYDLPIGYWKAGRRLYAEEAERQPEWAATLQGIRDSSEKLKRKDEELALADAVVVASSFTRDTLETSGAKTILKIPYGCMPAAVRRTGRTSKLRVLYVGALTQRKGISYLFEALSGLSTVAELTLIGAKPSGECPALDRELGKHRWLGTMSQDKVFAMMNEQDVLVFPSLFEGFGLVMLEALARGLPVIATPHTGGPDILRDGVDGWIVPIRDAEAIRQKLELLAANREMLEAMSESALQTARKRTWEKYRGELRASLEGFLKPA